MESVVIIEPHPVYRLGLQQLLNDALPQASIRAHDYSSFDDPPEPESAPCTLMLLSLSPSRNSTALVDAAMKRFGPRRILLVTDAHDAPDFSALPVCVAGSVAKQAAPEVLQASIHLVRAGGTCFPACSIAEPSNDHAGTTRNGAETNRNGTHLQHNVQSDYVLSAMRNANGLNCPPAARLGTLSTEGDFSIPVRPGSTALRESRMLGLTPRQYEVLMLLARGYPMKTVGRTLNISVATAKAHTETLYQRLDVHNRNAAVYAAVSRGATLGWANVRERHGESIA